MENAHIIGVVIFKWVQSAPAFNFQRIIPAFQDGSSAKMTFLNVSAMSMVVHAVKSQNRGKALGFAVT